MSRGGPKGRTRGGAMGGGRGGRNGWDCLFGNRISAAIHYNVRPCSHCHSCAGTVPICRISRVCERAMSAIKLDLISEN